jgi:16S rRNA G966 N2-methylase RsmD
MSRQTVRKSGRALTPTEHQRRWRANKKARLKAQKEAERRAKRVGVADELGILPLAIANISDANLASGSVDAVITDPPYARLDVPLYGDLARFAMRVLKPSGWCLAMVGDLYFGRVSALMTQTGLIERGLITITFPGGHHSRIGTTRTFQAAKTILLLQKPPARQPLQWGPNLIAAAKNGHDKSLHRWQQNQAVFEKLIERFTVSGDLVADPFAGSGTTLRAARALSRSAWGCDVDAKCTLQAAAEPIEDQQERFL